MGELPAFITGVPEESLSIPKTEIEQTKEFSDLLWPGATASRTMTFSEYPYKNIVIKSISVRLKLTSLVAVGNPVTHIYKVNIYKNGYLVHSKGDTIYINSFAGGYVEAFFDVPFYDSLISVKNDTITLTIEGGGQTSSIVSSGGTSSKSSINFIAF